MAVRWIDDNLIFAEGDWYGQSFRLRPDQKRFLWRWYEFCGGCGEWRYTDGLRGAATGDRKTAFVAAIVALEFAGPPQISPTSPNVPISAASFEQADLLFSALATMLGGRDNTVTAAPLCGFFEVYDTEIKFADGRPGKAYRVAAVAGTNEGGLPTLFVRDELHEWGDVGDRKARVATVIGKSTKKRRTRRGPGRILSLSTAGFDVDHSLLGAMYKLGKRAERDPSAAPRFLFDWQEAPEGLNYDDPADRDRAVRAASRAADVLWSARDRVAEWGKPEMPAHEWLRYYANRWVGVVDDSWLADHPAAWANCRGDATIPAHADVAVTVDMALRRDSVAALVAWKRPDGRVAVQARIWAAPSDGKIDHLGVLDHIRDLGRRYTVAEVAYDPRFFEVPARILEDEGFNMVEFPQSVERMAPACGHALQMIVAGDVVHDGDPGLTAHVMAAAIRPGERGFTLSKGKSRRKIDACIALVIALARVTAPEKPEVIPWAMWV
jgi:phage terminase large subunit-like protein